MSGKTNVSQNIDMCSVGILILIKDYINWAKYLHMLTFSHKIKREFIILLFILFYISINQSPRRLQLILIAQPTEGTKLEIYLMNY